MFGKKLRGIFCFFLVFLSFEPTMEKRTTVLVIVYMLIAITLFVVYVNLDSYSWSDTSKKIFDKIFSVYGSLGVVLTIYLTKKAKKNTPEKHKPS